RYFKPWPEGGNKGTAGGFRIMRNPAPYDQQLDVNGDGLTDLLRVSDTLQVWINTGARSSKVFRLMNAAGTIDPAILDEVTQRCPIMDFNGDGRDDIVVPTLGVVLLAGPNYQFQVYD